MAKPIPLDDFVYWSSPAGQAALRSAKSHEKHKVERNRKAREKRAAIKAGTWVSNREQRAQTDREYGITPEMRKAASKASAQSRSAHSTKRWANNTTDGERNKRLANQRYWQRVKAGLVAGPQNRQVSSDPVLSEYDRKLREQLKAERKAAKLRTATSRNYTRVIKKIKAEMEQSS